MSNVETGFGKGSVFSDLAKGRPVYDWDGSRVGAIKDVSIEGGVQVYAVESRAGTILRYREYDIFIAPTGVVLLPPVLREVNRVLFDLSVIWGKISEADELLMSGTVSKDEHDERVATLLAESGEASKDLEEDRGRLQRLRNDLKKERALIYKQTLELEAKHLLGEVSDAEKISGVTKLREKAAFLGLREQIVETISKNLDARATVIGTRTKVDVWKSGGLTGIFIEGTKSHSAQPESDL